MTVNDYIRQRFQAFGIDLSEADLLDICLNAEVSGEDEMCKDCHVRVFVAIARFIPSLLLRATSVNESGFSMAWDINGVKSYYSFLCKKNGIKDELNEKATVRLL